MRWKAAEIAEFPAFGSRGRNRANHGDRQVNSARDDAAAAGLFIPITSYFNPLNSGGTIPI
jgi:hypothetical protein